MPRYYFQLTDQGQVFHDSEGTECRDDEAARHEAAVALTEVAREVLTTHSGGAMWPAIARRAVDAYVDANVTTLAQARGMFKAVLKLVAAWPQVHDLSDGLHR
jgi:hypothetical protein